MIYRELLHQNKQTENTKKKQVQKSAKLIEHGSNLMPC